MLSCISLSGELILVEVDDKEMTGSSSVDKKKENEWFELISLTLPCLLFSVPLCFAASLFSPILILTLTEPLSAVHFHKDISHE